MNKKHISLMLAALMCFTSIIPSFAYDLDEKGNSVEEVEYQNTEDEDYTNVTNVFAEIGSEYKVTIPKVIVLSGVTKSADYYVKVEGDIAGYETVNVVPDESVNLYTSNKQPQIGVITQDKTSWQVSDFSVNANGKVSADGLTAGKWSGVFNFYINMDSHEEMVLGDIVLPPIDFDSTSPAQTNGEIVNLKVGESGNIDITYENEDVANDSTITSSDENVVKVDKNKLTAVGEGTSTITVDYDTTKSGEDNGIKSYLFDVKVTKETTPAVKDNLSVSIENGDTLTIGDIKIVNVTTIDNSTPSNIVITSSDESVAKIVDGKVEAVGTGNATITISADESVSKTIDIIVEEAQMLEAGLYDANGNQIKTWDELVSLGLNIEKDYTSSSYQTTGSGSGYDVFTNNNLSGKLILPDSVTTIGYQAFKDCTNLTNITIPDSVTTIGIFAFSGCTNLTSITIPDSVTTIGASAFYGCAGLTNINVASNNPVYDSRNNCNAIIETSTNVLICGCKNTVIPDSVTTIGQNAFAGRTNLTSITIPNSVTKINSGVFSGCTSLTNITIPNSVTSIGGSAFYGCTNLTSVTIPNSVTSIGSYAFYGCTNLTSITIPDSVTTIDFSAFKNCTNLTSITIPDSVTTIGASAFAECTSLESVKIPSSVTSIGGSAFDGCTGLTSVTIPNSITKIESGAFMNCTRLTNVTIPYAVTTIGVSAFNGCTSLTSVTIPYPSSVTTIESGAFMNCTSLTNITIPYAVTKIGFNAFYNVPHITYRGKATGSPWGAKSITNTY